MQFGQFNLCRVITLRDTNYRRPVVRVSIQGLFGILPLSGNLAGKASNPFYRLFCIIKGTPI